MTIEPDSLFREIAQWIPAEQREGYWEMVAHLRNLSPDDEILRICQAMGVLALITRQVPAELISQREAWQSACADISARLQASSQEAQARSAELTRQVSGLAEEVGAASDRVALRAEQVEKALRTGADGFSTEKLARDVRATMEASILKPAEEVVQKSAETFRKLEQGVPKLESIMHRLEEFSMSTAFIITGTVCGFVSLIIVMIIWTNLDGWYRTSLADEIKQINARHATSMASLQTLNRLGKEIEVYPLEGNYVLTLPDALQAYISTTGHGVIKFKKK